MPQIQIATESDKVIREFGVKILYYESWLCSCVAKANGAYDPACGCLFGYHYKNPVEYIALRSGIDYRRIQHQLGEILNGGCGMTFPCKSLNTYAVYVSNKEFATPVDLSSTKNIKISINGGNATQINLSSEAGDTASVHLFEIIQAINNAGLGEIAYECGSNGDLSGSNYLCIRSLTAGAGASVRISKGSSADALGPVFGATNTIMVRPSLSRYDYLPIYHRLSRGDVIVMSNRTKRNGDILRRGSRDKVNAFDIQRIVSVTKEATRYYEGIDYSITGETISWKAGKGVNSGEDYTVEYISKINYIVVDGLPIDRGSDGDIIPKKVHLALRTYNNSTTLPIEA